MGARPTLQQAASLMMTQLIFILGVSSARADVIFNVNTTADQIDQDVSDGLCQTSNGACSLRAALMQANHLSGPETTHIILQADTYVLTRPASGSDGEDNGDLNLTAPLAAGQIISIEGASAASSVIDANQIDGVMVIAQNRVAAIRNVTIRDGYLSLGYGGGIRVSGTLTMQDSVVSDNFAALGGGIYVSFFGSLDVLRGTFDSNRGYAKGGAVFSEGPTVFRDTTMTRNSSSDGGAIYFNGNPTLTVQIFNSTISNNSASRDGGGIVNTAQLFVVNSTISGNVANGNGGGIANTELAWLYNTSIINNDSSHDRNPPGGIGGGVYNQPGKRFVTTNALIADNTTLDAPIPDDCNGVLEVYGFNLLADVGGCSFTGNGLAGVGFSLPNTLGPLANNGGPTMTHALLAASEAIDTTTAQGCIGPTGALLATDQRGAPRIAGTKCDVGAYEYGSEVPASDVIFSNGFD